MCYSQAKSLWEVKAQMSHHNGCNRHRQPNVYNKLSKSLLSWITNTIGNDKMISHI